MDKSIPSLNQLKIQARQLRQTLAGSGHSITHAQALERTAHQWGARDWNTLCAMAPSPVSPNPISALRWQIGQSVHGRYISQTFTGTIKAAIRQTGGFWRLTLIFDHAVDVVTSEHFSNFRKQVSCTINSQGVSPACTSDGEPQMRLFPN